MEGLVRHDLEKMKTNANRLPAELKERIAKAGVTRAPVENITLPPALHFTHCGSVVNTAKRVFCWHRFTDAEVAALLAGQVIEITATSPKTGEPFTCRGTLEAGVMEKGNDKYPFVGFKPQFDKRTDLVSGVGKGKNVQFKGRGWGANEHWSGKDFTEQELAQLFAGETIEFEAKGKTGKPYTAKGALAARTYKGQKTFGSTLKFDERAPTTKPKKRKATK